MTEIEKIEYAKSFIDKMAKGINPLDDSDIPEDDLLNNVRISRCLFFVSETLQKTCDDLRNKDFVFQTTKKQEFAITPEQLSAYTFDESPTLKGITMKINYLVDQHEVGRLRRWSLTRWLKLKGYISSAKAYRGMTQKGEDLGISCSQWLDGRGRPRACYRFNENAQRCILEHIEEIVAINNGVSKPKANNKPENQGKLWDLTQDNALTEMFKDGLLVKDIAIEMKRTEISIRARLVKLGLIKNTYDAS